MALAGAALTTYSLVNNDGAAGALTAIGAGGLGLGLGYLVRRRKR
jgi:LPXTG-motif cell wall-anchored protein